MASLRWVNICPYMRLTCAAATAVGPSIPLKSVIKRKRKETERRRRRRRKVTGTTFNIVTTPKRLIEPEMKKKKKMSRGSRIRQWKRRVY